MRLGTTAPFKSTPMRIAATADLHFVPSGQSLLHDQLHRVREDADVLVVAGDLTNYGQPSEMEPLLNLLVPSRVPTLSFSGITIMSADTNRNRCA
jgi:3',5'-cyclic AMP phosphodiesterase CpdA